MEMDLSGKVGHDPGGHIRPNIRARKGVVLAAMRYAQPGDHRPPKDGSFRGPPLGFCFAEPLILFTCLGFGLWAEVKL